MNNIDNSKICFNHIYDNAKGIAFIFSTSNDIFNNTVEENDVGIWVFNSGYDHVFWNRFINNTQQYDFTSGSSYWWNLTYGNGGGNYWSDYTGADIYSGVNQDEAGRDFIGDTPYDIGTITDYYPLINASGWVNLTIPAVSDYSIDTVFLTLTFLENMNTSSSGVVDTNSSIINETWVDSFTIIYELPLPSHNASFYFNLTGLKSRDGYEMQEFNETINLIVESEGSGEPEVELTSWQLLQSLFIGILALVIIIMFFKKMKEGLEEDFGLVD